jgi:hypothetical protein
MIFKPNKPTETLRTIVPIAVHRSHFAILVLDLQSEISRKQKWFFKTDLPKSIPFKNKFTHHLFSTASGAHRNSLNYP